MQSPLTNTSIGPRFSIIRGNWMQASKVTALEPNATNRPSLTASNGRSRSDCWVRRKCNISSNGTIKTNGFWNSPGGGTGLPAAMALIALLVWIMSLFEEEVALNYHRCTNYRTEPASRSPTFRLPQAQQLQPGTWQQWRMDSFSLFPARDVMVQPTEPSCRIDAIKSWDCWAHFPGRRTQSGSLCKAETRRPRTDPLDKVRPFEKDEAPASRYEESVIKHDAFCIHTHKQLSTQNVDQTYVILIAETDVSCSHHDVVSYRGWIKRYHRWLLAHEPVMPEGHGTYKMPVAPLVANIRMRPKFQNRHPAVKSSPRW